MRASLLSSCSGGLFGVQGVIHQLLQGFHPPVSALSHMFHVFLHLRFHLLRMRHRQLLRLQFELESM